MWRQDIAEENQAQPQMARGCLPLYQCETDDFPGPRGRSTFYKPLLFFIFFSGLTLILKTEAKTQTEREDRDGGRGGGDEKRLQDAGNIWFHIRRPKRKLQIDKTLMF